MSHRIHVCDDEPHITLAVSLKLTKAGFTVTTAHNGQAAWNAIQNDRPELLISDLQMPQLDGLQLVQRLRESPEFCELPVILLTAKGMELDEQQLRDKLGIRFVMCKPFSPRELLKNVQTLLGVEGGVAAT